jgi:hypothetical protein
MRIVELILDEESELGIEAISVVESPAIEEEFVALKSQEFKLAEVDKERRILMGALLVPNKPIYRRNGEDEYYIYFSKDTVLKASQMYLMNSKQNNATLEHQYEINGLSLVESWIVEDKVHDKSVKYGMDLPLGTWVGSVKVNNDKIWNEFVRTNKVKGFSIEGYFADRMERPKESIEEELAAIDELEAEYLLTQVTAILKNEEVDLESYSDYPDSVKNNAKRGIELNEKVNNKCATQIGKVRAQQLAQGKAITKETIKRMFSYLSRAEEYYNEKDTEACGTISYLLWGGKSAKTWAESKLKQLEMDSNIIDNETAIIDDRLAYSTKEAAKKAAKDIGCDKYHEHEFEGKTWFMPCESHNLKSPCWDGYEQKGTKVLDGKTVPNCVKIK